MNNSALKVTLIVPVYNGERYASAFLDSLSGQTRFPDQVLFINDGSTDNSLKVLSDFAKKHRQVKIISQVNEGAGKARNRGVADATGDIIGFADIDDVLDAQLIARVFESFDQNKNLDVVVLNGLPFWEDGRPVTPLIRGTQCHEIVVGEKWITERLRSKNFDHYACLYYVKNQFIQEQILRFSEGIGHEDVIWVTKLVLRAQRLLFINECLYHYRQRSSDPEGVPLRNRVSDLESAIANTLGIGCLLEKDRLQGETYEQLRKEFVSGGCSKSHEFRRISDKGIRQKLVKNMFDSGLMKQLWKEARGFKERFRVIKAWFRVKAAEK